MQEVVREIYVDDEVKGYILSIVRATRAPQEYGMKELGPLLEYGSSPRGAIYLGLAARAMAFLHGRGYATPQDVKEVAFDVLRHRLILTYEAEAEKVTAEDILRRILTSLPVP